ncbi:glucosylglycerol-phosphate synthase [Pseudoduganella albidiflava]|uniref:Alpha,alpha-trehalose-phosphate synthase n=1 Tax=Pseudoduganella albidiflava TaxID=321983 RepID=A0A411WWK9_9BURK|nr:glucosylglycerol-phosphate synthase [Pseudoduganella albidiflava]QBI01171.1 glucosylglycerol-phosphate synthase [Pseudoduganella albidiflava]GGY48661.1 alpha,alpha-trehalose-phosphate synthase [Pseudoduganella albidiflava]
MAIPQSRISPTLSTPAIRSITPHQFLLATDLDGTLLAGTAEARRRVRELFTAAPRNARLAFVTGRGLESILPLLSDPTIPMPDYIIADVGATIVHGADLQPVGSLQQDIAARWPGSQAVLKALAGFPRLRRQSVPQERRCSFVASEADVTPALRAAVEALGCDLLMSAGAYLDVLPRGVGKGPALLALAEAAGIAPSSIVVAGDTLNDLSMFETGLAGIVVGAAEPALVQKLRRRSSVYIATGEGCDGILEGLVHHGALPRAGQPAPVAGAHGDADLVMVYHRLPFDEVTENGVQLRRRPKSPNGIIPTLLRFFAGSRKGSWVAWSQQDSRAPKDFETHVAVDEVAYPRLRAARVALTAQDVDLFYKKFSKEAFWPIIFSFPDKAEFNAAHWERFLEVNRLFAEQTAREAADGAVVWVHDYNLWMVPAFLRPLRPDLRIAFFHHTAFPSSDVFNILPWRRDIIGSLLQCDYVGFHIPRYVENFVDAVRSFAPVERGPAVPCAPRFLTYGCALGVDTMTTSIEAGGRTVALGAHPVGTDVALIEDLVSQPQVAEKTAAIEDYLGGTTGIVSIERLDYVKGSLEKLQAFERLLERHPEHIGKVTLLNIITPAAPGMEIYDSLRVEVDRAVGRINGRFSTLDWVPVRYFYRSLPFDEVIAHYAACGVAWITPLRDGLNLVAKEYVAARKAAGKSGVLILSEFAGAAVELHGALLTNPYDANAMTATLHQALTMGEEERAYRTARMAMIATEHDVARWGRDFLEAVMDTGLDEERAAA